MMASQSETRKYFPRRTASKGHAVKISAPMLTYTDAENRQDLYALPPGIVRSITTQSIKPTRSKLKKKIHIADLTVGRNPPLPSAAPTSIRKPVRSPTIGVALESPAYWPSTRNYARRGSLDSCLPPANNILAVPSRLQSTGTVNKEPSRKLFSSIFGRKSSIKARNESYKTRPSQISQTLGTIHDQQAVIQKVQRMPSTATAAAVTPWKQEIPKPLDDTRTRLKKATTMPFEYPSRPPSPPPKDFPPRPPVSIKEPAQTCPNCTVKSPMLKINIPDIKLERYSVMFRDVLKPRQSLLARRRAQLKDLEIADTSIPVSLTSLSNLLTNVCIQDVPKITYELGGEHSAAAPSSQLLPYKLFFSEHPNSGLGVSQRAGLSRSNTVPTSHSQLQPTSSYPKQTNQYVARARSPSYGSETPTSIHSEWQSQESPGASDTSDEEFDDGMCENIIIQLEDISLPYGPPIQRGPGFMEMSQDSSVLTFPHMKRPIQESAHLQNFIKQSQPPARGLSHNQASTTANYNLPPFSAAPHGNAPSRHLIAEQQRQQVVPPKSHLQQTATRPFHHLNPLTSSPASPTEITTARQLSWTRSQQIALVYAKQAVQPQITTIANSGSDSKLKVSNDLTLGHSRNKSELVVVESV